MLPSHLSTIPPCDGKGRCIVLHKGTSKLYVNHSGGGTITIMSNLTLCHNSNPKCGRQSWQCMNTNNVNPRKGETIRKIHVAKKEK